MSLFNYFRFFLAAYFLVGMHIILDTPGGTGLYLSFNIIAWLVMVVLIALGLWQITLNKRVYYSKMLLWLTLGSLCLIVPVFYNFEFTDHAIPRLLALTAGLLFLFCLYQFNVSAKQRLQLLLVILLSVAIEAAIGLAQFFLFEPGFWGGYKIGSSRPHGVFLQPNVMASYMATGLAIALYLSVKVISGKLLVQRHSRLNYKILIYGLIYFSLFGSCFLLIMLQSRTGSISAGLVLLLIVPYLYQKSRKQLTINAVVLTVAVLLAFSQFDDSAIPKRGSEIYQSMGARGPIFTVSLDMIKEQPIKGYGYGNFERSYLDHANRYAIVHPEIGNIIKRLAHPHNEVLFWAIEGGIVALLGFIFFAIAYLTLWCKIFADMGHRNALALLALLTPILLHSQLEFPFYSSVSHFLVFILLLWFTDSTINQQTLTVQETSTAQPTRRFINCPNTFLIRFFALFIPAIFLPFLATSLHTANILVEQEKNGYQSIEKLKQIINPIAWQTRLDAAVYAHILMTGLTEHDANKLTRYIAWGLQEIKHKPRISIYSNTLLALKILNRQADYTLLLNEAKRTYPQHDDWQSKFQSLSLSK